MTPTGSRTEVTSASVTSSSLNRDCAVRGPCLHQLKRRDGSTLRGLTNFLPIPFLVWTTSANFQMRAPSLKSQTTCPHIPTLALDPSESGQSLGTNCRVEELALPTRAIQLSGEELSTDEAASVELRKAEAVHWTRNSCRLFKAAPMIPCVCQEQQLETGVSNKRLKHTLEFYSTAAVQLSQGCSVLWCRTQWWLCGREPPGPGPHTTWRFSSARPRIALGYSRDKRNQK